MREARARESREEGKTWRRANAEAMREARARESREEEETRRRANAEAMTAQGGGASQAAADS